MQANLQMKIEVLESLLYKALKKNVLLEEKLARNIPQVEVEVKKPIKRQRKTVTHQGSSTELTEKDSLDDLLMQS